MLNVIMLNVMMLNGIILNLMMLNAIVLNVVMLSVITLIGILAYCCVECCNAEWHFIILLC